MLVGYSKYCNLEKFWEAPLKQFETWTNFLNAAVINFMSIPYPKLIIYFEWLKLEAGWTVRIQTTKKKWKKNK